jgi:GDP-L-fucose synthase
MVKTILITGSSGLVGNAFKQIASQYSNYEFIFSSSKCCNLINYEETYTYLQKIKPNYVIHLAANVGGLYKNMNYKVDMLEKNLLINFNILKCCYEFNVEKCICILSTCIFPDKTSYPIDETMLHNGPPHSSNDAYAYAKRMMEIHCRSYNEQYKTNFSCIIPTNIYGHHDNFSLEDGHVIPSLIHKCYLAKKQQIPFEIRGTGKPLRQFIYSEDLAKIIMELLDKLSCENIIISPKEEYSISDIALVIAKEFDYEQMIIFNDKYSDGQFKKTANNNKLMSYIPNFIFTNINEGIKNTVEFFKNNINNSDLKT